MNMSKNKDSRHFSSQNGNSLTDVNVSNKKNSRNKENINLFNEVSNLLQYYQSSSLLKSISN